MVKTGYVYTDIEEKPRDERGLSGITDGLMRNPTPAPRREPPINPPRPPPARPPAPVQSTPVETPPVPAPEPLPATEPPPRPHVCIVCQKAAAFREKRPGQGHQMMKCVECGAHYGVPRAMIMEKLEMARRLFRAGHTDGHISRRTGWTKQTVKSYRRLLFPGHEFVCPCGKPHSHPGWCKFRLDNSPTRKKYLDRGRKGETSAAPLESPIQITTAPCPYCGTEGFCIKRRSNGDNVYACGPCYGLFSDGIIKNMKGILLCFDLIKEGKETVLGISTMTGLSVHNVKKYKDRIEGTANWEGCVCGRENSHRGTCEWKHWKERGGEVKKHDGHSD